MTTTADRIAAIEEALAGPKSVRHADKSMEQRDRDELLAELNRLRAELAGTPRRRAVIQRFDAGR
jgi:hypothetical protein